MAKLGKPAAAIAIMAAIIAVLLTLCTPRSTSKSSMLGADKASLRYDIAERRTINELPPKRDRYRYSAATKESGGPDYRQSLVSRGQSP